MKIYELLSFSKDILRKIDLTGLKIDDYKYVDLYDDYCHLKGNGEKVTYIINHISIKYTISERKVYSIVKMMQEEVSTEVVVQ